MRLALAVLAGAAFAVMTALILADQLDVEVVGVLPLVAAVLVGVVEAELISAVAARRDRWVRAAAAVLSLVAMAWGTWIAYDPVPGRSDPLAATSWAAIAVAPLAGALSVRRSTPSADGSPTSP